MVVPDSGPLTQLSLPPGFRFYPTDEELMVQYLCRKVAGDHFPLPIIGEIDLYKFDPWVLPGKALFGEKEWYFFSPRDRKYPNGSRPNRVAGSGYWKATGTDKVITSEGRKVGIKKALVFYMGRAPRGTKTNWIMHEYRLFQSTCKSGGSKLDDWVLCRIYKKKPIGGLQSKGETSSPTSSSHLGDVMDSSFSFPEVDDRLLAGANLQDQKVPGLQSFGSGFIDWSTLAGMADGPDVADSGPAQSQTLNHLIYDGNHVPQPSLPPLCHVESPEEKFIPVGEAMRSQRVDGSGDLFGQRYPGSVDPFGIRYGAGYGFGM